MSCNWRGAKSPLLNNKKVLALAQEMGRDTERSRSAFAHVSGNETGTVWIRYVGRKSGNYPFQNPKTMNTYNVSAARPEFEIRRVDLDFMLSQKERGRRLFERVTR